MQQCCQCYIQPSAGEEAQDHRNLLLLIHVAIHAMPTESLQLHRVNAQSTLNAEGNQVQGLGTHEDKQGYTDATHSHPWTPGESSGSILHGLQPAPVCRMFFTFMKPKAKAISSLLVAAEPFPRAWQEQGDVGSQDKSTRSLIRGFPLSDFSQLEMKQECPFHQAPFSPYTHSVRY